MIVAMETRTCYRHEGRETGRSCTRCGRPACPDCLTQAPVGHHCPECIGEARPQIRHVRRVRWRASAGRPGSAGVQPVVAALVALNVVIFVVKLASPTVDGRFADVPLAVASGQWYRLVTAAFLHANLVHLGLNMLSLVIVGRELEVVLGKVRFLALYLVSALGGSVCFFAFGSPQSFALGASTATFGLFAALFVVARARQIDTGQIVMLIVFNLFLGLAVPGIDNLGHIGGLLTGAAVAYGYEWAETLRHPTRLVAQAGAVVAVVAMLSMVVAVRAPQVRSASGTPSSLSVAT